MHFSSCYCPLLCTQAQLLVLMAAADSRSAESSTSTWHTYMVSAYADLHCNGTYILLAMLHA
jgi:hypothetical protein